MLKLHELPKVSERKGKRVGRGRGSNKGKTSGRGHKGQSVRGRIRIGFEGGQSPLIQRLPFLRGKSFRGTGISLMGINLNRIVDNFKPSELVDLKLLISTGMVDKGTKRVKVLGRGEMKKAYKFGVGLTLSKRAAEKIVAAGGELPKGFELPVEKVSA